MTYRVVSPYRIRRVGTLELDTSRGEEIFVFYRVNQLTQFASKSGTLTHHNLYELLRLYRVRGERNHQFLQSESLAILKF